MPISLKNMRGCASPASTAICSSTTDHRSMIRHSTTGTPRHRRLNSYLHDQTQHETNIAAPCISELPITPRSLYKKHFSEAAGDLTRRRSSAELREYLTRRPRRSAEITTKSPPPGSSSRFLLTETASSFREELLARRSDAVKEKEKHAYGADVVGRRYDLVRSTPVYRLDSDKSGALVPGSAVVKPGLKGSTCAAPHDRRLILSERSGSVKSSSDHHQVVVLRVSLHCKGCVAKLRKHLSKMEGVTSFSIDLETKRVRVIGSVSPSDVLTSISKVKNAQFWPSPATSSSTDSSFSSSSASTTTTLSRSR